MKLILTKPSWNVGPILIPQQRAPFLLVNPTWSNRPFFNTLIIETLTLIG